MDTVAMTCYFRSPGSCCSIHLSKQLCLIKPGSFSMLFTGRNEQHNTLEGLSLHGIDGVLKPFKDSVEIGLPLLLMQTELAEIRLRLCHHPGHYTFKDPEFDNMCGKVHIAGVWPVFLSLNICMSFLMSTWYRLYTLDI